MFRRNASLFEASTPELTIAQTGKAANRTDTLGAARSAQVANRSLNRRQQRMRSKLRLKQAEHRQFRFAIAQAFAFFSCFVERQHPIRDFRSRNSEERANHSGMETHA